MMINPVQIFYENNAFENLKETKPFLDYLDVEKRRVGEVISGGRALDIGCGNGRSTEVIAGVVDEVVGIDFSQRLIEQARGRLKGRDNVKVYLGDAVSTHFDDDEFDYCVMLWNTLGNLYASRNRVLSEAKRVLKPDGKLIVSAFSENVLEPYLDMLKSNDLRAEHVDENYVFLREGLVSERFSREKLEGMLGPEAKVERLCDIAYWCEVSK